MKSKNTSIIIICISLLLSCTPNKKLELSDSTTETSTDEITELHTQFGTNGFVTHSVTPADIGVSSMTPLSNNEYLITTTDSKLIKLSQSTNSFTVDSEFAEDGVFDITKFVSSKNPNAGFGSIKVTSSSSGKIYISVNLTTWGTPTLYGYSIIGLNSDGNLNMNFGVNGYLDLVSDTLSSRNSSIKNISTDNNDNIYLLEYSYDSTSQYSNPISIVKRYNNSGVLDTEFGNQGILEIKTTSNTSTHAEDFVIKDDFVYVTGDVNRVSWHTNNTGFVSKYQISNSNLIFTIQFSANSTEYYKSIKIDSNDNLIAAGLSSSSSCYKSTLVRLTSNGNLDSNFGSSGIAQSSACSNVAFYQMITDMDDVYFLVDSNGLATYSKSDGSIAYTDTTWGIGSKTYLTQTSTNDVNKYIIAQTSTDNSDQRGMITLRAYQFNNTNPPTIDSNYTQKNITLSGGEDVPGSLIAQNDGKIIYAVLSKNTRLVRLNVDGSLDTEFGNAGIVETGLYCNSNSAGYYRYQIDQVLISKNEKLVFTCVTSTNTINIKSYNSDGTIDENFNSGATLEVETTNYFFGVHLNDDNSLLINGLNKINLDTGEIDLLYALEIVNNAIFSDTNLQYTYHAFNKSPSGNIYIAFSTFNSSNSQNLYQVARLNSDGQLDSSFGTNGVRSLNTASAPSYWLNSISVIDDQFAYVGVGPSDAGGGMYRLNLQTGTYTASDLGPDPSTSGSYGTSPAFIIKSNSDRNELYFSTCGSDGCRIGVLNTQTNEIASLTTQTIEGYYELEFYGNSYNFHQTQTGTMIIPVNNESGITSVLRLFRDGSM